MIDLRFVLVNDEAHPGQTLKVLQWRRRDYYLRHQAAVHIGSQGWSEWETVPFVTLTSAEEEKEFLDSTFVGTAFEEAGQKSNFEKAIDKEIEDINPKSENANLDSQYRETLDSQPFTEMGQISNADFDNLKPGAVRHVESLDSLIDLDPGATELGSVAGQIGDVTETEAQTNPNVWQSRARFYLTGLIGQLHCIDEEMENVVGYSEDRILAVRHALKSARTFLANPEPINKACSIDFGAYTITDPGNENTVWLGHNENEQAVLVTKEAIDLALSELYEPNK